MNQIPFYVLLPSRLPFTFYFNIKIIVLSGPNGYGQVHESMSFFMYMSLCTETLRPQETRLTSDNSELIQSVTDVSLRDLDIFVFRTDSPT